jgi:spermidine synthase
VIISEPSNPWIAGVGSLFTAEFYELALEALEPDGIIAQWVQLYELSPEDVRMVMAEFQRHFPEVTAWNMGVGDLILIGSREPLVLDLSRVERIVQGDPSLQRDFRDYLGISDPFGMMSFYVMSSQGVRDYSARAPRNTDDLPRLEFNAPRNLFSDTSSMNEELLHQARSELMPPEIPDPHRERVLLRLMGPLIDNGEVDAAGDAVIELAQTLRENDDGLYLAIARLSLFSSAYASVEENLVAAETAAAGTDDRYAAYREELWARMAEQQGDRAEAIVRYERAAAARPDNAEYLLALAELNAEEENWEPAALWMERYLATNPYPFSFYTELLGEYLIADGRELEAVRTFEEALEIEPYSYLARVRLAEVFEGRGQADEAIELLEFLTVYAVDRDAEIYTRLANIYFAEERWSDARRLLEKAARVFPADTSIYTARRELEAYLEQ